MNFQDRVARANVANEERKSQEHQRIQAAIEARRHKENIRKELYDLKYEVALTAFQDVRALEIQRDAYAPKNPDDEWHPKFCEAIQLLPGRIEAAKDCWYGLMEVGK